MEHEVTCPLSYRSVWFLWKVLTCELVLCLRIFDGVVHRPPVSLCRICDATAFRLTLIVTCGVFLLRVWWHSVTLRGGGGAVVVVPVVVVTVVAVVVVPVVVTVVVPVVVLVVVPVVAPVDVVPVVVVPVVVWRSDAGLLPDAYAAAQAPAMNNAIATVTRMNSFILTPPLHASDASQLREESIAHG